MVEIKLRSFLDGIATIECFPEGKKENAFQLVLDVENQKILENTLNEKGNSYAIHSAWKMFDAYATTGELPESATAIWH